MGPSVAFLQFPAFAILSQYFDKRRAAAIGLAVSGSSIGGVIFPIVLSKLLNDSPLSFGWSIRITAFIMTPFMLFACLVITPRVPPRAATMFIGAAWKEAKYVLLVTSLFFMMMGMWTPIFYLPIYAVSRGMSALLSSYLLSIINGSSTLGRIIPGVLADKLGRQNMFAFSGIATGAMVFCINVPTTSAGIVVYSVFFGFVSGTIISAGGAAISLCTRDPRNAGTYMGMGMGLAAFAVLIGPPVNGALIDRYGGFTQVSIFSGVVSLIGGVFALSSKLATPEGIFGKV
jgi:MFS family permease